MDTKHPDKFPALQELDDLTGHELRTIYAAVIHKPPPKRASAEFLRSNIVWTLQAGTVKLNPLHLRQTLINKAKHVDLQQHPPCKAGTRLIREWQGHTHEVTVLDKGYLWQGTQYRSLSRIAREITGARWSGPRFFGIKKTSR